MNSASCRWWLVVLATVMTLSTARSAEAVPQTAADVIPAPLPAEENAAPLYLQAISALETEAVWDTTLAELAAVAVTVAKRDPLEPVSNIHIFAEGNRQAVVQDVLTEFARQLDGPAVAEAMDLLDRAAAKPRCRFDIDYTKGPAILLPHLVKMRNLGRFLTAAANSLAEQRDAEAACHCVQLQLILAHHLHDEPLLISQLVRTALITLATESLQRICSQVSLPANASELLDPWLAHAEERAPWVLAFHGERILLGEWAFAGTPEEVGKRLQDVGAVPRPALFTPEQLAAELAAYRGLMLRLTTALDLPYVQAQEELAKIRAEAARPSAIRVTANLVPSLEPCVRKVAESQAGVRIARIALRLERYRAEHAAYPVQFTEADLTGIAPESCIDPFTGQPFRYRTAGKGFVLYSVGPDAVDNDGRPRQGNEKSGYDIVWQAER